MFLWQPKLFLGYAGLVCGAWGQAVQLEDLMQLLAVFLLHVLFSCEVEAILNRNGIETWELVCELRL